MIADGLVARIDVNASLPPLPRMAPHKSYSDTDGESVLAELKAEQLRETWLDK